jgi:Pin2-interacting protein X1
MAYTALSGSKLRAKLGSSLNESASAPTSVFAKKQLEKMGWSEGSGLGKNGQGMNTHIKVKKRATEVGLGHSDLPKHDQISWWADTCGDTLSRLSGNQKKTMTDQDLFQATGGARFGMRAQRKQTGKWARAEKNDIKAEEEAMTQVEWNGTGQAKVIFHTKENTQSTSVETLEPKRKKTRNHKSTTRTVQNPKPKRVQTRRKPKRLRN